MTHRYRWVLTILKVTILGNFISSSLGYIGDKWAFNGDINTVRSNQDNVERVQQTDANIEARYFLKKDWFLLASADFLSNDEQLLKLRSTLRSDFGKYIIHSNHIHFGAGTSLAWNNERYTDTRLSVNNSLEGFLTLDTKIFDIRDLTLDSDLSLYPSITEKGRLRVDFNLSLKYDLPQDFFVKLSLLYNYDNKPIEDASTTDNVFQATVFKDDEEYKIGLITKKTSRFTTLEFLKLQN